MSVGRIIGSSVILGASWALNLWTKACGEGVRRLIDARHSLLVEDTRGAYALSESFCRGSPLRPVIEIRFGDDWVDICTLAATERDRVMRFRGLRRYYRVTVALPISWFAPVAMRTLVLG